MAKKHLFIIIVWVLSCIFSVQAQSFKGGFHLGLLASQVDGDERGGYHKPGLFAGAFVYLPLKEDVLNLQFEINYAQKGAKSQRKRKDQTLDKFRILLQQIEMPVLLNYCVTNQFSVGGGPSFNLLVHKKIYSPSGELVPIEKGDFRFFELGILLGANYSFKEHFGASFRFGYSLTPIGSDFYVRRRILKGLRNNFLQFHLSYQF